MSERKGWSQLCKKSTGRPYVCDFLHCSVLWKHILNRIFWFFPEHKHKGTQELLQNRQYPTIVVLTWGCFWHVRKCMCGLRKVSMLYKQSMVSCWICESWQPCSIYHLDQTLLCPRYETWVVRFSGLFFYVSWLYISFSGKC